VHQAGSDTAEEIEDEISDGPEVIFDIIAEDPEKKHVSEQVQDRPVHEERKEQGEVRGELPVNVFPGWDSIFIIFNRIADGFIDGLKMRDLPGDHGIAGDMKFQVGKNGLVKE